MKTMVDSCAWSLLLRRRDQTALRGAEQLIVAALKEAIQDGHVLIIGPIRQEVLSGIKEASQFEKLRRKLEAFEDEPLRTVHYEEAAHLYNLCRSRGVECGPTDILICAAAIQMRCSILTCDGGMKRCIQVLQAEGIMQ
ncbi:MAG TPA: PIN domain-containing protein [Terracidiphilus sp.]|jgi:hypothetical protein|nr:PIN domain-containing protein [Terracidiphilus sp.]